MTSSNPFDLPGMGPNSAANPIMQSLDMMSKAWQQFAQAQQNSNAVFSVPAALNPEELDKRIQELKSIENWLTMNLSMLSGTIQGLEIQRASIHTLKTFVDTLQTQKQDRSLDDIFGVKKPATPQAAKVPPAAASQEATTSNDSGFNADAVSQASQAWWDMLQGQFTQLANVATQATQAMHKEPAPVKSPPGPEPDAPTDPQEPVKPATRKRATASRPAAKRSTAGRRST